MQKSLRSVQIKQQLQKTLPPLVLSGVRLPLVLTPKWILYGVIEKLFNHALQKSLANGEFDFLKNRWLMIAITDFSFEWCITATEGCFRIEHRSNGQPIAAKMQGKSTDLIKVLTQQVDADTLFFQRKLVIEGDTEFALEVKNTLDSIDLKELPKPYALSLQKLGDLMQDFSI